MCVSLEQVDPSVDNNYAIRQASENGHLEVVKILLNTEPLYSECYGGSQLLDNVRKLFTGDKDEFDEMLKEVYVYEHA